MSHDLRTPITSLRLLADAIEDGLVDSDTSREYVARMSTHVRALGALIDDLFELTRLESGELRWSMEQVALDELIRETVEAMRPQAEASSVAVRAVLERRRPAARTATPRDLQRVLFNLIQNAIRHTPADGSVTVRTVRAAEGVEIEVADTGSGIPLDDRERVFEPFHRGRPGAQRRRRWSRPGDLAGDRRAPRRPDLDRRRGHRHVGTRAAAHRLILRRARSLAGIQRQAHGLVAEVDREGRVSRAIDPRVWRPHDAGRAPAGSFTVSRASGAQTSAG